MAANVTWGASVTDGTLTGTIALSSSLASAAISNSGQWATECGLTLTYNASATKGGKVEVLRTTDGGTTYQVDADGPYGFNLPFTANTTEHYVFTIMADVSQFKINLINLDSGQSITAVAFKYRQANWQ
jgi:2',3'-cyclic-nucleotide 2'-phosphodiesterase (5'-nucleotidase family)